jgi:DnaJ-class molecular chaperone
LAAAVRADPGARGAGPPGQDSHFRIVHLGFDGFQRRAAGRGARGGFGGGGIDDISRRCSAARPGGRSQFEPRIRRRGGGRDVTGTVAITLPEVLTGTSRRVHLPTGKEIDAKIPAGLADGQTIRLKGQGCPARRRGGDALITVTIAEHPLFKRDGANLRLEVPVTLYEAVLGGKVRVPTLDGAVELAIPPAPAPAHAPRQGQGPARQGRRGDLYATIRIVLPESGDAELEELMKKWRDEKPYDPRRDMS